MLIKEILVELLIAVHIVLAYIPYYYACILENKKANILSIPTPITPTIALWFLSETSYDLAIPDRHPY